MSITAEPRTTERGTAAPRAVEPHAALVQEPRTSAALAPEPGPVTTLYADFTDPYAYVASRQVDRRLALGLPVPRWLSVAGSGVQLTSRRPDGPEQESRDRALAAALELVRPHEQDGSPSFPDRAPGLVPHTGAATAAYAEALAVGAGEVARRLILQAYWVDGLDIGVPAVLRALLMAPVRAAIARQAYGIDVQRPPAHPEPHQGVWAPAPQAERADQAWRGSAEVLAWTGNTVSVTGGPITTAGHRCVRDWMRERQSLDADAGLVAVVPGRVLRGSEVLEHLAVPAVAGGRSPRLL